MSPVLLPIAVAVMCSIGAPELLAVLCFCFYSRLQPAPGPHWCYLYSFSLSSYPPIYLLLAFVMTGVLVENLVFYA